MAYSAKKRAELWESLRATRFKENKNLLWPGIKSQGLTDDLAAILRLTSSKSKSTVASIGNKNLWLLGGYFTLVRQRQNKAARQRCRAVPLHQLERLAHAHEAQVCAVDSFCEDDGARQPMSWSFYRSACPIGLKCRGVRLNYVEFVLHNTAVTNRQI